MVCIHDYFERFLTQRINTPLLEGYATYTINCAIVFSDTQDAWLLEINKGKLILVTPYSEKMKSVSVTFIVNQSIFSAIVRREISPQKAFFQRKTAIKGNIVEGMKLAKILALFFEHHSYTSAEAEKERAVNGEYN